MGLENFTKEKIIEAITWCLSIMALIVALIGAAIQFQ